MKKPGGHEFIGTVVSTKMHKTILVKVVQSSKHPLYQKMIKHSSTFAAHIDDTSKVTLGDTVKIHETKPISRTKHFVFVEKV